MQTLAEVAIAAILSLLPAKADRDAESVRLAPLAAAIAQAVREAPQLPFHGPASEDAAVLALVAIASHESGFDARVIDCRRKGLQGDATAFQLLGPAALGPYTIAQLCASPALAAERAVWVLSRCRSTPLASFRGYASGRCDRPAPVRVRRHDELVTLDEDAGATRCRTWVRLAEAAGLVGAKCDVRRDIRRKD